MAEDNAGEVECPDCRFMTFLAVLEKLMCLERMESQEEVLSGETYG